jgi:hypothetical protein
MLPHSPHLAPEMFHHKPLPPNATDNATALSTAAEISAFAFASASHSPPNPDELYNNEAAPLTDGKTQSHGYISDLIADIQAQIKRGNPLPLNPTTIVRTTASLDLLLK